MRHARSSTSVRTMAATIDATSMRITTTYMASSVLLLAMLLPVYALAQTPNDDLRTAIQASVMSDPRVSDIPPVQLKALVDSLLAQAEAQHMTAADILWQPREASAATMGSYNTSGTVCESGWQGYLCQFNIAFGFEGGSWDIPLVMLVVSGLLIAVIWELIVHHRRKMAAKAGTMPIGGMPK